MHLNYSECVKFNWCFYIIVIVLTVAFSSMLSVHCVNGFYLKFDLCLLNTVQMLDLMINRTVTRIIFVN